MPVKGWNKDIILKKIRQEIVVVASKRTPRPIHIIKIFKAAVQNS